MPAQLYRGRHAPRSRLRPRRSRQRHADPRLSLLPNGNYVAAASPVTALFSGWTGAAWPAAITRDFARIAVTDIESQLVGVDRSDTAQGDPNLRVAALRNTAATPFLAMTDAAATPMTAAVATGAAAIAMSPVMDTDWGALAAPSLGSGAPAGRVDVHRARVARRGHAGRQYGGQPEDRRAMSRPEACRRMPGSASGRMVSIPRPVSASVRTGRGSSRCPGRAFIVTNLADGTAAPAN